MNPQVLEAAYCPYLWHSVTILCDGRVTCGLDDASSRFCYGNIEHNTLREIWTGEQAQARRWKLVSGELCLHCKLSEFLSGIANREVLIPDTPYPRRMILEPTIACNLRCGNGTCRSVYRSHNFGRERPLLPWDTYVRLFDEAGQHLEELHFYNYGESFLHPRAADMLEYAKRINPRLRIYTSTNAVPLTKPGAAARVAPLIESMVFTIAGANREAYQRYHGFDRFDEAFEGMRLMAAARTTLERPPRLIWRYIVFRWNDSDGELAQARALAREIGVELSFLLTADPLDGMSLRRAPGTPGYAAIADCADVYFGYGARLIQQEGLFAVERSSAGLYCWTGKKARLVFRSLAGELNLRLRSAYPERPGRPGAEIRTPWQTLEASIGYDAWSGNSLKLPAGHSPEFAVEIESDRAWQPSASGIGPDERQLGVAVAIDEWRDADCLPGA